MLEFEKVPPLSDITSQYKNIKAAFWDMDGTLFDSELIHMNTMIEILGVKPPYSEQHKRLKHECTGLTDDQVLTKLQSEGILTTMTHEEFIKAKDIKFTDALKACSMDLILKPEVETLINELKDSGIKIALVTSSERFTTDLLMEKSGFLKYFEFTITKQDVTNPKPDPGPYLMAMERMGVSPRESVIFEDSPTGLAAAKGAGANIVHAKWYTAL